MPYIHRVTECRILAKKDDYSTLRPLSHTCGLVLVLKHDAVRGTHWQRIHFLFADDIDRHLLVDALIQ